MRKAVLVEISSSGSNSNNTGESGLEMKCNAASTSLRRAFFFILAVYILFPSLSFSATEEPSYQIRKITVKGLTSLPQERFFDLLSIRVGKAFDRGDLNAGIKRAFLTGLFNDISVETVIEDDGLINITVKEKEVIASIQIKGNEHFSKRFVKKQLTVSAGEKINAVKVSQSIKTLKDEMVMRGFADAQVNYSFVPRKKNRVSLIVEVKEGDPLIIKDIVILGPEDVIRSRLSLSRGDIYDRTKLQQTSKKVIAYYREAGHIGASMACTYKDGIVSILLNTGKILTVSFVGNTSIHAEALMKEVLFFELNEFSDDLLDETRSRIEALYHRQGYPFAQVAPVQTVTDKTIGLEFFIFEGESYRVNQVNFTGATISSATLRTILELRPGNLYNPDMLEADTDTLVEFYHALGYIYAEIHAPELKMNNNIVDILYLIKEGTQVKLRNISMKGKGEIAESELVNMIPVKPGQPYNEVDITDARRIILDMYNKRGFIDARVTAERSITDAFADIAFTVQEGAVSLFGKVIIIGNERTRHSIIEREIVHQEGHPLDYSLLLKEKQELYRLGLFSDIEITPLEKSDTKRDIIYKLTEANNGAVEFGFGYGEYEKYRGFVDLSYRNLWGMNRQASFRTEMSSLEQRYILSYNEPWFFYKELTFRALLLHENRKEINIDNGDVQYRLKRDTASAGIEKKILGNVKAELYYDFSVVNTFEVQPDIVLSREDVGTLIISGIRPGLLYDTRDNPFEPKKGTLAGLTVKFASSVLFSQTDFTKVTMYANKYYSLHKRVVLALSARVGAANGFGSTRELPIVERFFLGGRTTVRGYAQDTLGTKGTDGNPTGGNAFVMGNVELRADVGKGFGFVTFIDGGNVWRKLEKADIADLKYTTGMGIRYNTPVGPFRIDYGHKLNRETGESRGEIHFSLGHAF
jgi:outer membrane protein insertion porin family